MKRRVAQLVVLSVAMLSMPFFAELAFAQSEDDKNFLLLYFKEDELVVESATRSPKHITQVAENMTVVTAAEIELMNAHTLADVLNTVSGVQVLSTGGPGSTATVYIQGSQVRHVAVYLDGIPLNNLSDNVAEVGSIPVQNIEKIEVIKGPASSVWGSSLGGIINILTKTGDSKKTNGVLATSYGERDTGDFRAEISGNRDSTGYYLSAGRLQSDGLRAHNNVDDNNFYLKLNRTIENDINLAFTAGVNKGDRGAGESRTYDIAFDNKFEDLYATLSLAAFLNKTVGFDITLRAIRQRANDFTNILSTGSLFDKRSYDNKGYGTTAKLTYNDEVHNVVIGTDYDNRSLESNRITSGKQDLIKWAVFLNDTITVDKLSVTPGVRYDNTGTNGSFASPSLGITYLLTNNTILRAYAARGFNTPPLFYTYGDSIYYQPNTSLEVEKIWSYQIGLETTALQNIWVKLSLFRHDIRDSITLERLVNFMSSYVNGKKQRRQGAEIELKTIPIYDFSLISGATFIDAKDLDTGRTINNNPKYTYDLGLQYDDRRTFKALLRGRYIWWDAEPIFKGEYNSFVFDVNFIKSISLRRDYALEVFLNAHNIFNASQYLSEFYKNPRRWIEGGIRYKF